MLLEAKWSLTIESDSSFYSIIVKGLVRAEGCKLRP